MILEDALDLLGANPEIIPERNRKQLSEDGFTVFEAVLGQDIIENVKAVVARLFPRDGRAYDRRAFCRQNPSTPVCGDAFKPLLLDPLQLACVRYLMPLFELGESAYRSALPGCKAQEYHVDAPDTVPTDLVQGVWMLDAFTREKTVRRGSCLARTCGPNGRNIPRAYLILIPTRPGLRGPPAPYSCSMVVCGTPEGPT
ncbi:MAG: hypothetical protein WDN45_12130 [Caulobacteraceae bacterium]